MSTTMAPTPLTAGQQAILRKLARGTDITGRYGQRGWVYNRLPKGATAEDVRVLISRGLVEQTPLADLRLTSMGEVYTTPAPEGQ